MDFRHSDRSLEVQAKAQAFLDEHVYPNEAEFEHQADANRAAASVQSALTDHGVAGKDLQTSGMSIQQSYDNAGKPNGYQVTESLTAVLRDLGKAGTVVGAAVSAGGDAVRVDGLSVGLQDSGALMTGARADAMSDARTKAVQYAQAAGRPLGAVQAITEMVQNNTPTYDVKAPMASGAGASAVPIQAGSSAVTVQVTVTYAFG